MSYLNHVELLFDFFQEYLLNVTATLAEIILQMEG